MTSEIHPTIARKWTGESWLRRTPRGQARWPRAGLIAIAVLLFTTAAIAGAAKTRPRDSLDLGEKPDVGALALSPDGATLAVRENEKITLWDIKTEKRIAVLKSKDGIYRPLAFTPDGKSLLATGIYESGLKGGVPYHRACVNGWDLSAQKERRLLELPKDASGDWIVTPDGKSLIVATCGRGVGVYDLQTGKRTSDLKCDEDPGVAAAPLPSGVVPPSLLTVSADGKTLALATPAHNLFLFDLGIGKARQRIDAGEYVNLLALSPDGKRLFSCGAGDASDIRVWDVTTGKSIDTLRVGFDIGRPYALAFSPDGKTLAMVGEMEDRNAVELWDIDQFGFRDDFSGRAGGWGTSVLCLVFSPDGKTLITAGGDAPVRLWDVPAGAPKAVRQDPNPPPPPPPPPGAFFPPIPPRP